MARDRAIRRRFQQLGVDATDFVDRRIARIANADHIRLHAAGFNAEWKAWFRANRNFTLAQLKAQMRAMMNKHNIPQSAMNQSRYCR